MPAAWAGRVSCSSDRMGRAAREKVTQRFLAVPRLVEYAGLITSVNGGAGRREA